MKYLVVRLCIAMQLLFVLVGPVTVCADDANKIDKNQANETVATKKAKTKDVEEPNSAIKLESVFVGDKEQPAISYFIPWQGVGTPDKLHWNVEEKHDQALGLVDREIMLRSIHIYEEMQLESGQ